MVLKFTILKKMMEKSLEEHAKDMVYELGDDDLGKVE